MTSVTDCELPHGWHALSTSRRQIVLIRIITPYARVGGGTLAYLAAAYIAIAIILWSLSPFTLVPTPLEVFQQVGFQISRRGLLYELGVSLWLNLEAVSIASTIALILAYSYVVPAMRPIVNFIARLRYFGIIGISFFFLLFIRDSHWVKVAILVFGLLPYLTAPMVETVSTIEDTRFNHARTLRLGHWGTTWQVVIRGRMHPMIEVIRQNAAIAWMMVATVEGMIRSEGGVGVLLVDQAKYLRMADILAILSLIFVVGALQDILIRWIGNLLCPYATLNTRSM
jgi:NitT/TauT family transport system permease protein